MAITTYAELKTAVQNWLNNDNVNVVAAIPEAIAMAEARITRVLRTWEMECRVPTELVPDGTLEEDLGYYGLPDDWAGRRSVVRRADDLLITYWARIPPLSDSVPTNWLLAKHPDIYLYGSLMELSGFAKSAEEIKRWSQAYTTTIEEIVKQEWDDSYPGSGRTVRASVRPSGALLYVTPKEYDEMEAAGEDFSRNCASTTGSGYFTVSAGAIRIWPKPAMP
jgi:hypothetical protein